MNKIYSLVLLLIMLIPINTSAQNAALPRLDITGVVVLKKPTKKLRNSAIVDDKIWWEGDSFIVENGKLTHRIDVDKATDKTKLMKLVKIELDFYGRGQLTFEYQGEKLVRKIRTRK